MSEHIVVNDKTYLPSGDLAKAFSYTIDYLSRLAREGKVDATRIGRQWFINPESLDSFIKDTEQKKVEQRAQLRAERKREFHASVKNPTTTFSDVVVPIVKSENVIARDLVRSPYPRKTELAHVGVAVTGSTLVVVAGLLFAVVIAPSRFYNFASTYFVPAPSQQHAGAFLGRSEAEPVVVEPAVPPVDTPVEQDQNGVVLLEGDASVEQVQQIKELFSDEVNVDFTAEDVGTITPVFKEKTDESYQFIMVPVKDSS